MTKDIACAHDPMSCLEYLYLLDFFSTSSLLSSGLPDRRQASVMVEIEIRSIKESHPSVSSLVCKKPTRLCTSSSLTESPSLFFLCTYGLVPQSRCHLPFANLPLATHALRPLKLLLLILDLLLISYLRLEHEGKGDANANLRPASRSLLPSFRTNVRQSHMYDLP